MPTSLSCLPLAFAVLVSAPALHAQEKRPPDVPIPYTASIKPGEKRVIPLDFGNRTRLTLFQSEKGKLQEVKSSNEQVEIEGRKEERAVWSLPGGLKARRWYGEVEEWSTDKNKRFGTGVEVWVEAGAKETEIHLVVRLRHLFVIEPVADGVAQLRVRIVPPKK
jgi:hypothetical protein